MTHDPYFGPGPELLAMIDCLAVVDPALMPKQTFEEELAQQARFVAAYELGDLSPEDQAFLQRAVQAVNAGGVAAGARTGDYQAGGGDWVAEDEALDAGRPVEPAALVDERADASDELTASELAELAQYDDTDTSGDTEAPVVNDEATKAYGMAPDAGDEGWVGL